ncbi:hypothetical protein A9Q81_27850 [Gammaproteobacteria bacterium 42_54_T18]|nr:hypothetical protein A9Q81_27850 [Gammaproteobacteria bacterium 42_54_T18]
MSSRFVKSVWNGIEHGTYANIAQEIGSNHSGYRRWVSIYAIYKFDFESQESVHYYDFVKKSKGYDYCVLEFEISQVVLENDDGIEDDDIVLLQFEPANNELEIYEVLDGWDIKPESFVPEWKCDFPL